MSKFFPIRLLERRQIAPTVLHLAFVRDDGEALDYTPGQFIQIHFPLADGGTARRSYSCATRHDHRIACGEAVEFVASIVPGGAATALFQGMEIGDCLQASGPLGLFTLKPADANRRYLLIATGTGVASYRSMLPQLDAMIRERGVEVAIVHGARTPAELLFADEFLAMVDKHPGKFRYLPCLSREDLGDAAAFAGAEPAHGHVQDRLADLAPKPGADIAYICGNPNMVDAVVATLKESGLPMKDIRREKYISLK
ncbi:ferredoxin--NADP reductase [Solilutibacter silvestris]|uniref:ferredoxin--NADP(+) reductase n=1 Tax=Solilutibacter silvestris TaxID=1645665 RepID=A0A2K1Q117_9GAMM|nr:ferredoxin--NADP reductase [Lysobacter silvestris]PNS08739.1 Flavodoxin reductase (ferredoxin-NADPH reductases) family 1 [Lysobacter silvestris]